MKKYIIGMLLLMLCAGCGIGAFFFFRKGNETYTEEQRPRLIGLHDITIQEGGPLTESVKKSAAEITRTKNVEQVDVDISQVDANQAGTYPIIYNYTGTDGKKYQEEIQCIVKPKTADVPKSGTQPQKMETDATADKAVPKTGDGVRMMFFSALAGLSFAVACVVRSGGTKKI